MGKRTVYVACTPALNDQIQKFAQETETKYDLCLIYPARRPWVYHIGLTMQPNSTTETLFKLKYSEYIIDGTVYE